MSDHAEECTCPACVPKFYTHWTCHACFRSNPAENGNCFNCGYTKPKPAAPAREPEAAPPYPRYQAWLYDELQYDPAMMNTTTEAERAETYAYVRVRARVAQLEQELAEAKDEIAFGNEKHILCEHPNKMQYLVSQGVPPQLGCALCDMNRVEAERDALREALQRVRAEGFTFCECGHSNIEHYGAADWQTNPNCNYICGVCSLCVKFVESKEWAALAQGKDKQK